MSEKLKYIPSNAEVSSKGKESKKNWKKQAAKIAAFSVAIGAAEGIVDGMLLTIIDHRENTHRSVKADERLVRLHRFLKRTLGGKNAAPWPDAHLDHHAWVDVNAFPFMRVSRALNWIEEQRKAGKNVEVEIPESIKHLDPLVDEREYPLALVRQIGDLAEAHAKKKLGDLYQPPVTYSNEELNTIFHPAKPDYFYPKYKKKKRGDYTSDEMAQIVVSDPHSPAYADRSMKNGVKEILHKGIWPYFYAANLREQYPEIVEEHLKPLQKGKEKKVWPTVAAGFAIPAFAVLVARHKFARKDFAIAVAGGVIANGTRAAEEAVMAMAVNSAGHAGGELTTKSLLQAMFGKEFEIKLHPDGTVATDTTDEGLIGRAVSIMSLDEVGRQQYHHDNPGDRKYTDDDGVRGWIDATWGSVIDLVVKSKSKLLQPGDNFNLKPGERRPDEPHPATVLVQMRRKEQYTLDKAREKQNSR